MSDWKLLEERRVKEGNPHAPYRYWTDHTAGWNGMFRIRSQWGMIRCVCSDGEGWKHVSVSIEHDKRPPKWDVMCYVKDLFFEPEDWVVQFHPAHSEYVNHHPGCLHLWKSDKPFPTPRSGMVGPKS